MHVPGKVKNVEIVLKLADLTDAERNQIGSFTMTLEHNGADLVDVPLNFNAATGDVSLLSEPQDLPTTGLLSYRLQASDVAGNPLAVGGRSNGVSLDGDGGQAFAIVGRLDAPTPLATLRGGGVTLAASAGTGLLVHGERNEWIDLATGAHCDDVSGDCDFGAAPPARAGGIIVALDAFDAACPHAGKILLGLGRRDDAPLADLYLFDPAALDAGAFTQLAVAVQPRFGGTASATRDCRVILAGGAGAEAAVLNVEVIDFAEPITASIGGSLPVALGAGAFAIATRNALDEIVVAGGGSPAVTSGAVLTPGDDIALCALDDESCNGAAAALTCARAGAGAARIDDGSDQATTLVVGGAADCGAELFRSSTTEPFAAFTAVADRPRARVSGHTASTFGRDRAVVVGGRDDAGAVQNAVEIFDLEGQLFSDAPPLATARADHGAVIIGGAVVVAGGVSDAAAPVVGVEVIIPTVSP